MPYSSLLAEKQKSISYYYHLVVYNPKQHVLIEPLISFTHFQDVGYITI